MKKKVIYSFLLAILVVFGCVKERETEYSFLLGIVAEIQLSIEEKVFIVNNKKQTLDLVVKFLDESGNELAFGNTLKTEIWINDSLRISPEIDLSEEEIHNIKLVLPIATNILSNAVEIHVIALENAVDNIQLSLKNHEPVFIKYEDTQDFTAYTNFSL